MTLKEARLFVIEDYAKWRECIADALEGTGHQIVLTAESREKALAAIPQLAEMGVQVAILDGNLTSGDFSGRDAQVILLALQSQAPDVRTIGLSLLEIPGVDVNLRKINLTQLAEAIGNL